MDDLISRQAAIDVLEERLHANGYSNIALVSELNRSIGYIMQLPTAEKKGKWKHRKSWSMYVCDQCSFENRDASRYCPNCGARMEG